MQNIPKIKFSDDKHPEDWFRFEEPFVSPHTGPSYVAHEDAYSVISQLDKNAPVAQFYRLHGSPGNYEMTPVEDSQLVKKLTSHRKALIQAREHDKSISSTNPAAPLLGLPLNRYNPSF